MNFSKLNFDSKFAWTVHCDDTTRITFRYVAIMLAIPELRRSRGKESPWRKKMQK